jgi:hypothetical protein
MHGEGFLLAGYYLTVAALFLGGVIICCLVGAQLLAPLELFSSCSRIVQLAIWENIFLCFFGWVVSVLFFNNDCWTFDSMGWPVSMYVVVCAVFSCGFQ